MSLIIPKKGLRSTRPEVPVEFELQAALSPIPTSKTEVTNRIDLGLFDGCVLQVEFTKDTIDRVDIFPEYADADEDVDYQQLTLRDAMSDGSIDIKPIAFKIDTTGKFHIPIKKAGQFMRLFIQGVGTAGASSITIKMIGAGDIEEIQGGGAGAGGGGASGTDATVFTPGVTIFTPIGGQVDDTAPSDLAEGEMGVPRMTPDRSLHVSNRDAAGNNRGQNVDADGSAQVALPSGSDNELILSESVAVGAKSTEVSTNIDGFGDIALEITGDKDAQVRLHVGESTGLTAPFSDKFLNGAVPVDGGNERKALIQLPGWANKVEVEVLSSSDGGSVALTSRVNRRK